MGEFYFQIAVLSVWNSILKLKQTGRLGDFLKCDSQKCALTLNL